MLKRCGSYFIILNTITMFSSFDQKRRMRMQQEPNDLPASLALATKTLVMGVALGLSGVILDPIKGIYLLST